MNINKMNRKKLNRKKLNRNKLNRKDGQLNKVFYVLVRCAALLVVCLAGVVVSYASDPYGLLHDSSYFSNVFAAEGYTDEQVAAAKAWLSAHGYPPTRAGASQAYQDYLNGKFDNDPEVRRLMGDDSDDDEIVDEDSGDSGKDKNGADEGDGDIQDGSESGAGSGRNNSGNGSGEDSKKAKSEEEITVLNVADIMNSGSAETARLNKEEFESLIHEDGPGLMITSPSEVHLSYVKPEKKKDGLPLIIMIVVAVAVLGIIIYIVLS